MLRQLKFRQKIGSSFGVLIALVIVNALVSTLAAWSIVQQFNQQQQLQQTIREVDRVRLIVSGYVNSHARDAATQVFFRLDATRQHIEAINQTLDDAQLRSMPAQLEDFKLQFQKYMVEADQKSALQSRASMLGQQMVVQLGEARGSPLAPADQALIDAVRDHVQALQWAGFGLQASLRSAAADAQMAALRSTLVRLNQSSASASRNQALQRLLFRIQRDASDYVASFESYLRLQQRNLATENQLAALSEAIQSGCNRVSASVGQEMQQRIYLAGGAMALIFVLSMLSALLLTRLLTREILRPVQALMAVTQRIAQGDLQAHANVEVADEIGDLSRAFNHMTDSLRATQTKLLQEQQALAEAHQVLELRVQERTRQLASLNDSLQAEINQREQTQVELEAVNQALVASELVVRQIIDTAPIAIFLVDLSGRITQVNESMCEMFGYPMDALVGMEYVALVDPAEIELRRAKMLALIHGDIALVDLDRKFRRANGEQFWAHLTSRRFADQDGQKRGLVAVIVDITEARAHQQQLENMAHFDALTQLPNRLLLADRLHHAKLQSQRRGDLLAVAYLDLDGFKAINDTHGHDAGDALLVALAHSMKACLREGDTLARIGGDEFVAVLVDLTQPQDCVPLLQRLLRAASSTIDIPTKAGLTVLQVSASIGVTLYPQDNSDADLLLRHADQAMYTAKQSGKNRYQIFDVARDEAVKTQFESLEHIRGALHHNEFVLHYQPKVNLKTGQVTGAEALIRWQHPQRGLLAPAAFLPVMEEDALSIEVGEWVIRSALAQMQAWRDGGLQLPVSVNLGARQLQQVGFAERLGELLAAYPGVPADWLQLEVLETSAFEDLLTVSAAMKACHRLGVSFALDDFGTGYSSLTYLKRLPAATLKIDQSFVRDMRDDPNDLAIVNGVIGLAKAFDREVIAEGVETAAHGALLLSIGCELAQGYGISRPMAAESFPDWVTRWQHQAQWTA